MAASACKPGQRFGAVVLSALFLLGAAPAAFAHCDTLDGPVVAAARQALDRGNPNLVLIWVSKDKEAEIKTAFDKASRLVSHGCVRLEKPRELAQALLDDQSAWNAQAIDAAIDQGDTKRVAVDRPVAVFLFYWTAFVGADGKMNFLSDPYDWDKELLVKLSRANTSNA